MENRENSELGVRAALSKCDSDVPNRISYFKKM